MKKPVALVTGATGFTGWHMARYLLNRGYKVIATDIKDTTDRLFEFVPFIKADLTKCESMSNDPLIDAIKQADYIFHVAGLFNYAASRENLFKVNVDGTKNLFNLIIKFAKNVRRVINWGAGGVFGEFAHIPLPAKEDMPPKTDNPYMLSKLEQEKLALQLGLFNNIPVTVIRPSAVYGPRSTYGMALSITALLKSKVGFVIGHGQNKGALVHVQDIVRSAEFLAHNEDAAHEIYHVTDDALYNNEQITKHLTRLCGAIFLPIKIPERLALLFSKVAKIDREMIHLTTVNAWISNEKIKKLGFEFKYPDTKIGLAETVEWYKANKP